LAIVSAATLALAKAEESPPASKLSLPKGYVCHRTEQPIVIDGKLEARWADVPWTADFVDIEGDKKPRPTWKTRVKMVWDDEALYIAAELEEPHVGAIYTKHDSYIFHEDNDFEVFLDPDGDNHLYAELEMNALNTTWDLLLTKPYRDGGKAIDAWEIEGLKTAVHVDGTINDDRDVDRGWTIEIAWPWKGLKQIASCDIPPKNGDYWRINFSRVQWQREFRDGRYHKKKGAVEDNWVWSPQGAINMHMPEQWGELLFSTARPGATLFRPDPSREVRRALFQVYEAQAKYRKAHDRWATAFNDLGLKWDGSAPRIEATTTRYEAALDRRVGTQMQKWRIDSESRIWKE
jgi:hypothetical protein